jgi:ribosomal protein S18 acetylase RimI-like enzyme
MTDPVEAIEGNFMAWTSLATVLPGGELIEEADCTSYRTALRHAHFNGVLRARFAPGSAEGRMREIVAGFDARGAPMDWWLLPSSTPADLPRHLVANGFHRGGDWPGMAVELDALVDDRPHLRGLRCTEIRDGEELATWMSVHARSFGTAEPELGAVGEIYRRLVEDRSPGLRHYLGWYRGEPVAVASLFLAGGAAGVYNIGTLPEARGRGIGRQMTVVGLRNAREGGYRIGVLGASQMGLPMYRRLGFREYCRLRWMERPVGHVPHDRAHRCAWGTAAPLDADRG